MSESTTLTRHIALLSIVAMAGVALASGVAAGDHVGSGEITAVSAPDSVTTGEDIEIQFEKYGDDYQKAYVSGTVETSDHTRRVNETVSGVGLKQVDIGTDGLGDEAGEAHLEIRLQWNKEPSERLFIDLAEPESESNGSDLPSWAQNFPSWLIDLFKYFGFF